MRHPALLDDATEALLARCRDKLFAVRAPRVRPGLDDKVLADWNGLMIAALAQAGVVFERVDWLALAERAFAFVERDMAAPGGRLFHSWRGGQARHPASVDDYANLCRAALALFEATQNRRYLAAAEGWVAVLDRHYRDAGSGGYFFAADDTPGLIARAKTAADAAVPAGNGTLVGVLIRAGDPDRRRDLPRARRGDRPRAFAGEVRRNFFPLATLINNAELAQKPVQIVLVGKAGDAGVAMLRRAVYAVSLPRRILQIVAPGEELPVAHPAHGKTMLGSEATAYVCEGPVCSLPIVESQELVDALAKLRLAFRKCSPRTSGPCLAIDIKSGWQSRFLKEAAGAIVSIRWDDDPAGNGDPLRAEAARQLDAYFAGRLTEFDLPLRPAGSEFEMRVWTAMQDIPYGETRCYGDLAATTHSAPRAVGRACGRNPIPVVIPCHRVLGKGWMGGYSGAGGLTTKRALLELEGALAVSRHWYSEPADSASPVAVGAKSFSATGILRYNPSQRFWRTQAMVQAIRSRRKPADRKS